MVLTVLEARRGRNCSGERRRKEGRDLASRAVPELLTKRRWEGVSPGNNSPRLMLKNERERKTAEGIEGENRERSRRENVSQKCLRGMVDSQPGSHNHSAITTVGRGPRS